MAELGKAYIEVRADLAKFPAELRTKLTAALKECITGVEFTGLEQKAKAAGEKAGDAAGDGFNRKIKKKVEDSSRSSAFGFLGGLTKIFNREKDAKGGLFSSIEKLFSSATESGLKGAAEKLGQVVNTAGQLGGALSGIGGVIGSVLQIAVIAVLIPVVIQLAGALVQLGAALFALPAAIGVVIAIIAPLIIAFQGFGEAVGAGLSGDVDKFNEALKGLSPSARKVAKDFVGLAPQFKSIKKLVQEAFFSPLAGVVGPALKTILPTLSVGLQQVAHSLGVLFSTFLEVASDSDVLGDIRDVFATTARIVDRLAPALGALFGSFFGLAQTGLPFVERFFGALSDGITHFTEWLAKVQGSGQLSEWLEKATDVGKGLWEVLKQVGDFVFTLFGGKVGDQGRDFLHGLADEIERLNTFLKSDEGQEAIGNLTTILKAFGAVFLFFIRSEQAVLLALNSSFDGVRLLLKGLEALGGGFVWLIDKISDFAVWLGTTIGHAFVVAYHAVVGWVSSAGTAIADFFTKDIPRWFGQVVDWFKSLPGKALDALSGLAEGGRNLLIDTLTSWYDAVFTNIGRIIGVILSLPYLVQQGWSKTLTFIGDFISSAWDFAVTAFWDGVHAVQAGIDAIPRLLASAGDAIGTFFVNLGNSIWTFLTETLPAAMGTAMSAIGDFFVGLWNNVIVSAWDTVTNGFNQLMDFLGGLPGRVIALGPKLYNAALELGRSIGRGLENIGNFASDIGSRIVNSIKSGINYVIRSINSGIADIDNSLPISLPRIPQLAKGAIVDSPTLAVVGEAGREVVMPLNDPARARQLAEQSNLFEVLGRGGGQQAPVINLTAILDGFGVLRVVDMRINDALDQQGSELANGART